MKYTGLLIRINSDRTAQCRMFLVWEFENRKKHASRYVYVSISIFSVGEESFSFVLHLEHLPTLYLIFQDTVLSRICLTWCLGFSTF